MAEQRLHCAHVGAGGERARRGGMAKVVRPESLDPRTRLYRPKRLVSGDNRLAEASPREDKFAALNARRRLEDA